MEKSADTTDARQRRDHQDEAERHQDGGLQKIRNDDRPQPANHAVENDDGARAENGPRNRETARGRNEQTEPVQRAGAGEELKQDRGPGKRLMSGRVEARGEILHHRRDAAAPPSRRKDKISQQETQSVADVETRGREARAIRHPRGSRKSPSAEPRHEATQASDQPRHSAATAEVLRRAPIEAHHVQTDQRHEQRVQKNNRVVDRVHALHADGLWFSYTVSSRKREANRYQTKEKVEKRC